MVVVMPVERQRPLGARAEQGPVDDDRAVPGVVRPHVLELEALGQLEVDLDGRALPAAGGRAKKKASPASTGRSSRSPHRPRLPRILRWRSSPAARS